MKKYLVFGMLGAFALAFTACSSEEELAPNPTFDGTSVKAEFSLNLPTQLATRQQKAITQDGATASTWRKIDKLFIAPYALPQLPTEGAPVQKTSVTYGALDLAAITGFDHENAQDKWYNDVTLKIGTNAFLVYAKPESGEAKTAGALAMTMPEGQTDPFAALDQVTFNLKPIVENTETAIGGAISAALNAVANTKGLPYAGYEGAAVAWKSIQATDNALYAELFNVFKSLHAGSKTDVLAFLQTQLLPALVANTGDAENGIDVKVKKAVQDAIAAVTEADDFTADLHLPDGAAYLQWMDGSGFGYVNNKFATGEAWGYNFFTYPAELWYVANTGLKASNKIESGNVGNQTWAAFIAGLTAETSVKPSTQSVALVDPLQYGVANLETQIKFAKENYQVKTTTTVTETTDPETGEVTSTSNTTETVEVKYSDLKLCGILVGDQKNVDWQFKPTGEQYYVIYDTDLFPSVTLNTSNFTPVCQTLVCETSEGKNSVNVALEFLNNSTYPINGVDGIVPSGAKFYLIGSLRIIDDKNWDVETEGNKKLIFQQDYKTIAKFLINDLEKTAYNTIPDLRSPELEFGLSVDLEWQKGYEFLVPVGQGE